MWVCSLPFCQVGWQDFSIRFLGCSRDLPFPTPSSPPGTDALGSRPPPTPLSSASASQTLQLIGPPEARVSPASTSELCYHFVPSATSCGAFRPCHLVSVPLSYLIPFRPSPHHAATAFLPAPPSRQPLKLTHLSPCAPAHPAVQAGNLALSYTSPFHLEGTCCGGRILR